MPPAVRLQNVSKTFVGGVRAVDSISFELSPFRVYGFVGPNGAGKSTIMNLISGYLFPDSGEVWVNGIQVTDFHQALNVCGVVKVEQHPNLSPYLTPAEHLSMLLPKFIPTKSLNHLAHELLRQLGVEVDLERRVEELPIGHLRVFEIVKALIQCEILHKKGLSPVLILDEATTFLPQHHKNTLKLILRKLTSKQHTVLVVSHDLHEIIDVADEILVMVGGRVATRHSSTDLDVSTLVKSMFDTEVRYESSRRAFQLSSVDALVISNLFIRDDRGNLVVRNFNLSIKSGEVHGIAVIPGTGEKELVEGILGVRRIERGEILVYGHVVKNPTVTTMRRRGVAVLSDDRIRDGLITDASVFDNLTLGLFDKYCKAKGFFIDSRLRTELAKSLVRDFSIVVKDLRGPVTNLSGGNMQRVYIARVLGTEPKILLALHPTVGLDPMGASMFFQKIDERRERGLTSVIFSPNVRELLATCDRVSVMRDGEIVGTYQANAVSVEQLGMSLSGVV